MFTTERDLEETVTSCVNLLLEFISLTVNVNDPVFRTVNVPEYDPLSTVISCSIVSIDIVIYKVSNQFTSNWSVTFTFIAEAVFCIIVSGKIILIVSSASTT